MTHLKERAGFPIKKSLAVLNLPARTYHRWRSLSGKKPRPEGVVPKGHWILPEEREKIVAFKRRNAKFRFSEPPNFIFGSHPISS